LEAAPKENGKTKPTKQKQLKKKITEIQLENPRLTSLLLLSAPQSQPAPPFCTSQILPLKKRRKKKIRRATSKAILI